MCGREGMLAVGHPDGQLNHFFVLCSPPGSRKMLSSCYHNSEKFAVQQKEFITNDHIFVKNNKISAVLHLNGLIIDQCQTVDDYL